MKNLSDIAFEQLQDNVLESLNKDNIINFARTDRFGNYCKNPQEDLTFLKKRLIEEEKYELLQKLKEKSWI